MKEKLLEILDRNEEALQRYEQEVKDLRRKAFFCSQHKFEEELRIALIKKDSLELVIFSWREQQDELRGLLEEQEIEIK